MYRRILVTLDGSETSEAVLPEAERLALEAGATVVLLAVGQEPSATAETPRALLVGAMPAPGGVQPVPGARVIEDRGRALQRAREELKSYLEGRAEVMRAKGLAVETEVAFGEPVEEILAAARERDADVIAMATHGRTGLAQVIFGSVAARVVGSGVKPVLLVRPAHLNGEAAG